MSHSSRDVEQQDLLGSRSALPGPARPGDGDDDDKGPGALASRPGFRTLALVLAGLAGVGLLVARHHVQGPAALLTAPIAPGRSLILNEQHAEVLSGDTIYLRAHTDRFLEVTVDQIEARSTDYTDAEAFVLLRKSGQGPVQTGDVVYLQAQNDAYVTVEGARVAATSYAKGGREALVIETKAKGTIRYGDEVYLKAHTGKHFGVGEQVLKAEYAQRGGFQAFVVLQRDFIKECSKSGENCANSMCCADEGMQCFEKDPWWSQCKEACLAGPDPTDQSSPMPWSCKTLGPRTAGEPKKCSAQGESCSSTNCCESAGMTCFEKSSSWASCKPSCAPGLDMTDPDATPWSCKALGPPAASAAPWVATTCAGPGADCAQSKCCSEPGHQCYLKNEFWGQCRDSCTPGEKMAAWDQPWNCTSLGARTPAAAVSVKLPVQPWVVDTCSMSDAECADSHCCLGVGQTCFRKNENWATCRNSCNSTRGGIEANQTWSCEAMGPPSEGLALKGFPSLYCVSVMRVEGYEPGLMKEQMKVGGGIFACDGYDIVADGVITLGTSSEGREVITLDIPKIEVGVSQDGTAANTKLFMKFWDRIIATHKFNYYDWTAKVDPDAVLLPWRLRQHMAPHVGMNVYVVNCNKFPSSPNFPMMYGALEVFSLQAMQAYASGSGRCGSDFWPTWQQWGEDYFMTHCMDHLGVGRIGDFGILGDNMCTGANCGDGFVSTFHPFKTVASWMECWAQANPAPSPEPVQV